MRSQGYILKKALDAKQARKRRHVVEGFVADLTEPIHRGLCCETENRHPGRHPDLPRGAGQSDVY